jgi:hypothetical protein
MRFDRSERRPTWWPDQVRSQREWQSSRCASVTSTFLPRNALQRAFCRGATLKPSIIRAKIDEVTLTNVPGLIKGPNNFVMTS